MEHFDFIALGGGNAGLMASKKVAAAGKKVALIDPTPIGGLCPLWGCNPKKILQRATEVLQEVREAGEHGIYASEVRMDWSRMIDRKHRFTDPVTETTEQGLTAAGVEYIKAPPHFVAPDVLEADGRRLSFEGVVIATGSLPRPLSFPGAHYVSTSNDILELRRVPKTLAVIGAGVVAFEFGQVFARLGSHVHMLMHGHQALDNNDQDLVEKLVEYSRSLGITFHEAVEVQRIEAQSETYTVTLDNGWTLSADTILNAAGRPANIGGLNLDAAGVEYDSRGVVINDYLRSPHNARVFAAGDAHGAMELSPVASYEGRLVAQNFLYGDREREGLNTVPATVYTVPPLAGVGLTESQARARGFAVEVAAEDMSEWTVFRLVGRRPAHGKLIGDKATGRILGAHLYGPEADENINLFAMAMRFGITRAQLSEMVYVYPTFASALGSLITTDAK